MATNLVYRLQSLTNPRILKRGIGRMLASRLESFRLHALFAQRSGLELGGPSRIFGRSRAGLFPIYPLLGGLDNCNFNSSTVWQGQMSAGRSYQYDPEQPPGQQYFAEATDLHFAADGAYDFVLSSHVLEHSANPLKALHEWKRVLRDEGALFLALPHKDATFDHRRPVTTLQHIVEDYERRMDERDLTHLPEILRFHDLALDPGAGTRAEFALRGEKNFENRCLHQHVFDTRLAVELVNLAKLQILAVELAYPDHITLIAQRVGDESAIDNAAFLGVNPRWRPGTPLRAESR